MNVETTLCTSTLKFKTLNNVESTLPISTLIWTTLDNVVVIFNIDFHNVGQRWNNYQLWKNLQLSQSELHLFLFNVLENRNVTLCIVISHVVKTTILIGGNFLFSSVTQSNYCTIEIFNRSFLKKNIENKDSCKFDSYKRKSVRILQGFQIRASNTAIKY